MVKICCSERLRSFMPSGMPGSAAPQQQRFEVVVIGIREAKSNPAAVRGVRQVCL